MDRRVIYIVLGLLVVFGWIGGCQECDDCGILERDPTVNIRFYNIDSLIKVENALIEVNDSLDIIYEEIENGNNDLIEIRDQLEKIQSDLEDTQQNILDGKLRIEEVNGIGALEPLYFRDTTTNDSLTVFPFPLSIHENNSTFIIEIEDQLDTLSLFYNLEEETLNNRIIIQAYNLEIESNTFDSTKIRCLDESCMSDETTISIYF